MIRTSAACAMPPMKLSSPLRISSSQGSSSSNKKCSQRENKMLSFLNDFGKSALLYGALLFIAAKDQQVDLKEKFSIQASGISHLIDTYSDALIVVVMLIKLWYRQSVPRTTNTDSSSTTITSFWNKMPSALQYSYKGVLCFGVVATLFHGLGVDESGQDPHAIWSVYFSMVGAFILYWHAKGLMDLNLVSKNEDATDNNKTNNSTHHQRIQAHFLGLGVLPVWICLAGGSSAVTRFLFNGYGFFYAAFAMEPLLKQAVVSSPATSSLRWKLQLLRVLFPSIGFSYVVESLIVEHLQIDPHAIVHVLAMTYVLVMHSILSTLPPSSKDRTR